MANALIIHATELFDGVSKVKDCSVEIKGGKITSISKGKPKRPEVVGVVTPALIDAHSHIGMFRAGEPQGEAEGNETLQQIMPLSDPLKSVYFDDHAFEDAVDFGVLYSCIMPGSGNLFGGRTRIIKNFARHKGEALARDYGYKMALGFNPRSTQGWKGERPNTRMGIYAMLERRFDETLAKERKAELAREKKLAELTAKKDLAKKDRAQQEKLIEREFELEFTPEDLALLEVLHGKKIVKVHVHKEDDVIYLLELAEKYGMRVTAEHMGDVWHQEIFSMVAEKGIPIVYGPLGTHAYKIELRHDFYQNAKLLMDSGAMFGLMTDHPIAHVTSLRDSLKYFLMHGMSEADAIGVVTRRNAEILGMQDELGVLKTGKPATLLVWDGNPLHLASMPRFVMAEGKVLRARAG